MLTSGLLTIGAGVKGATSLTLLRVVEVVASPVAVGVAVTAVVPAVGVVAVAAVPVVVEVAGLVAAVAVVAVAVAVDSARSEAQVIATTSA